MKTKKLFVLAALLALLVVAALAAPAQNAQASPPADPPSPTRVKELIAQQCVIWFEMGQFTWWTGPKFATQAACVAELEARLFAPQPAAGAQPTTTPVAVAGGGGAVAGRIYSPFIPHWTGLDVGCPAKDKTLADHGLTGKVIVVSSPQVSWEACELVVELLPQYRGTTIPLLSGYQYTAATVEDEVVMYWGGDPQVKETTLQWGTTFRYGPTYGTKNASKWLDPADQCELVTREFRFGLYRRNTKSGQPDVPYYDRLGPYETLPGNTNCPGWVMPGLDQVKPDDYLQATAMIGGLARKNEWKNSPDKLNWAWRYSAKGPGSATYCPPGDPCWQTVHVPQAGLGYVEMWVDGGPKKFFARDLSTLLDGLHNVDEFSYHADPNR